MAALLEIQELTRIFHVGLWPPTRIRAVDRLSLRVGAGETLGLAGESGCGKTTLGRCAVGLLAPTSGSVRFEGVDLASLSRSQLRLKRREFQMVFQDASGSLNPRMTAEESIREPFEAQGLGTSGERERRIRELLDAVALDPSVLACLPALLSGGQQQRLAIARALALGPRLVVADEPVSALDASVQAQIINLLAGLRQKFGLTLILISHSLPVVRHLCTHVAVMYLGRIVEEAPAELFFGGPKHPYSEHLIRCAPVFGAQPIRAGRAAGDLPSAASPPSGCAFHPRCPHARERCRRETPPPTGAGGSTVACFLYT